MSWGPTRTSASLARSESSGAGGAEALELADGVLHEDLARRGGMDAWRTGAGAAEILGRWCSTVGGMLTLGDMVSSMGISVMSWGQNFSDVLKFRDL